MKKFKHKATGKVAYPFNIPAGEGCYTTNKGGVIPAEFIENSNDWEEIKEPNYKILSFRSLFASDKGTIYINNNDATMNHCLTYKKFGDGGLRNEIYSIQRLSDNQIFTVDDTLQLAYGIHKIASIKLINGQIVFHCHKQASCTGWSTTCNCTVLIQNAKKALKPIFTTVDGKPIYKGDDYWLVRKDMNTCSLVKAMLEYHYSSPNYLEFSTEALGKKWLEDNQPKPLFTTEDNVQIFKGGSYYRVELESYSIHGPYDVNNVNTGDASKLSLVFSTIKKAEEYVLYNKPCLSINDVAKIYVTANRKPQEVIVHGKKVMKMGKQPEDLLKLVKTKIKL